MNVKKDYDMMCEEKMIGTVALRKKLYASSDI